MQNSMMCIPHTMLQFEDKRHPCAHVGPWVLGSNERLLTWQRTIPARCEATVINARPAAELVWQLYGFGMCILNMLLASAFFFLFFYFFDQESASLTAWSSRVGI